MLEKKRYISIICPIYKGNKYIRNLIKIANENNRQLDKHTIELVLVNDYPKEKIQYNIHDLHEIKLHIIESEYNRGIHGARVLGLKECIGEYVLFLDQDDCIKDDCLKKMINNIGKSDAIACNAYSHTRRSREVLYNQENKIENIWSLKRHFFERNRIVSPGQVLLKRTAIPKEWSANIMKYNGADDWYLWLLLMKEKKQLAVLNEILFIHTFHGKNTSDNKKLMEKSRNEVIYMLRKLNIISNLEYTIWKNQLRYLEDKDKKRLHFLRYPYTYMLNLVYRLQRNIEKGWSDLR